MPLPQHVLIRLRELFGERLLLNEPLARHTSARIGGPADAFLPVYTRKELAAAARVAWAHEVPLFILGGGSNILVSERGVRGLVIHNRADYVVFDGARVTADAGVSTISLARRCAKRGLSGLEWAIGIPGTLGGAVFGNAGAHGGDMRSVVLYVDAAVPKSNVRLSNSDLAFQYRSSVLKRVPRKLVILRATLQLKRDHPAAIAARMEEYNTYRRRTQPPGATIGSMFKNPEGDFAGRLVEAAGLKGARIGGAQISTVHANFFVNLGGATADDVRALIDLARNEVLRQFGVELELEIELVGEW